MEIIEPQGFFAAFWALAVGNLTYNIYNANNQLTYHSSASDKLLSNLMQSKRDSQIAGQLQKLFTCKAQKDLILQLATLDKLASSDIANAVVPLIKQPNQLQRAGLQIASAAAASAINEYMPKTQLERAKEVSKRIFGLAKTGVKFLPNKKRAQVFGSSLALGAITFAWLLGHTICHSCMEAVEPQTFWTAALPAVLISYIFYKINNSVSFVEKPKAQIVDLDAYFEFAEDIANTGKDKFLPDPEIMLKAQDNPRILFQYQEFIARLSGAQRGMLDKLTGNIDG